MVRNNSDALLVHGEVNGKIFSLYEVIFENSDI